MPDIALDHSDCSIAQDTPQVLSSAGAHVVDDHDFVPIMGKPLSKVAPYETYPSCDEHSHMGRAELGRDKPLGESRDEMQEPAVISFLHCWSVENFEGGAFP